MQDFAIENNLDDFRPNYDSETGQVTDTTPLQTIKNVIQSAYGTGLDLSDISITTYCACPNHQALNNTDNSDIDSLESTGTVKNNEFDYQDTETEFYTRATLTLWKKGELCAYNCPNDSARARVISDIEIRYAMKDLFNKETIIYERLQTRIR